MPNTFVLVVGGQMPVRERIEEYIVRNGDTLWSIANRFGLEPSTIVWANSLTNGDVLAIGQPLDHPADERHDPPRRRRARRWRGLPSATASGRSRSPPSPRMASVVAAARCRGPTSSSPAARRPPRRRRSSPSQRLRSRSLRRPPPLPAPRPTATPAAATRAVGSFIWPATGALTTYFGDNPRYYGPGGHNGLDIANGLGTPLLAADGGVVIFSGWRGGLGYAVGVDHENGFVTWYGHASSLAVGTGQRVARGQVVAYMGSTGNSTGSHIHFIVVRNGVYVEPARLPAALGVRSTSRALHPPILSTRKYVRTVSTK